MTALLEGLGHLGERRESIFGRDPPGRAGVRPCGKVLAPEVQRIDCRDRKVVSEVDVVEADQIF
jgi:hypothetical protein